MKAALTQSRAQRLNTATQRSQTTEATKAVAVRNDRAPSSSFGSSTSVSSAFCVLCLPLCPQLRRPPSDSLLVVVFRDVEQTHPGEAHFVDRPLPVADPV